MRIGLKMTAPTNYNDVYVNSVECTPYGLTDDGGALFNGGAINCQAGVTGRYLTISSRSPLQVKDNKEPLNFCEVKVFGSQGGIPSWVGNWQKNLGW
jgi:hypothetical protein